MASILNSVKNHFKDFSGVWEDIQWYPTVKVALVSPVSGEIKLQWTNSERGRIPRPEDKALYQIDVSYDASACLSFEKDAKARWFKLDFSASDPDNNLNESQYSDVSLSIMTSYKDAPTALKIVDNDENNVVTVSGGSLYTILVDSSGTVLNSTNNRLHDGEALFVNPIKQDLSNSPLGTNEENSKVSLKIALRDSSGGPDGSLANFSTFHNEGLADISNALYVRPSDSSGFDQAGTGLVSDACVNGVALYLTPLAGSTADDVTKDGVPANNSIYVYNLDGSMTGHDEKNPTPISEKNDITFVKPFDISQGITGEWVVHPDHVGASVGKKGRSLKNLYVYNDGPMLVKIKSYDLSITPGANLLDESDLISQSNYLNYQVQTISIPPGQTKEFNYPKGLHFTNGIAFRALLDDNEIPYVGAPENTVFVAGTYVDAVSVPDFIAGTAVTTGSTPYYAAPPTGNNLYKHMVKTENPAPVDAE